MTGHAVRVVFHWLTALLVICAFILAFVHDQIEDPDTALVVLDCHRALGLVVLIMTVLRLLGRWLLPFERLHEANPALRWAARINHVGLYLGLVAMPLLGWAQSSAKMRKFRLFEVKLPALVGHDPDLGAALAWWHETIGWAMLAFIGLHSLAALYHHSVRRDRVLLDMLTTKVVAS